MTYSPPPHAVAVILDGQIVLRVYLGGDLKVAIPLRWRRALLLASDLLNLALTAERSAGTDSGVPEALSQQRVAQGRHDTLTGSIDDR